MTFIPFDQDEFRSATYASLRAHAISEEAKALVSTLAAMVDSHALATGSRKNKRKSTAEKLDYAVGAFLADLLRAYGDGDGRPHVVRKQRHALYDAGSETAAPDPKQLCMIASSCQLRAPIQRERCLGRSFSTNWELHLS
jgi:hypothetical protein